MVRDFSLLFRAVVMLIIQATHNSQTDPLPGADEFAVSSGARLLVLLISSEGILDLGEWEGLEGWDLESGAQLSVDSVDLLDLVFRVKGGPEVEDGGTDQRFTLEEVTVGDGGHWGT